MPVDYEVVSQVLRMIPENLRSRVIVRHSGINAKKGRCIFRIWDEGRQPGKIVVAACTQDNQLTGDFYVIPGHACPDVLYVKPQDPKARRWTSYECRGQDLASVIQTTAIRMDKDPPAIVDRLA